MSVQQKRIDDLVARLRNDGFRLTPQRLALLKTIINSKEHLSVEDIYNRVHADYPMIGMATIYKTIALLKEMGVITEIFFSNEGARYDSNGDVPHPHFICTQCNCIIDIEDDEFVQMSERIARKTGYHITRYRLDFFGLCPNCQPE